MKKEQTRRTALGMIAGGGALLSLETAGFTTLSAERGTDVEAVADADEDAKLYVVEEGLNEDAAFESPHEVTLENGFDDLVEIEVGVGEGLTLADSDDGINDGDTVAADDRASFEVEADDGGDVTDTVEVTASGGGLTLEFVREVTIEGVGPSEEDEEIYGWFDAEAGETFEFSNDEVSEWGSRSESSNDIGDVNDDDDTVRPERSDEGWSQNTNASVSFEDDDDLTGDSVDVTDNEAAAVTVVAVLDGDSGDRAVSLVDDGNEGQQIAFDVTSEQVTVALEDEEQESVHEETLDLPIGTSPTIATVVVEGDTNDEEAPREFTARTYESRGQEEDIRFADRHNAIGDFSLGIGDDPVDLDPLSITSGDPYEGDVAEVLIYNRAIDGNEGSDDELDDVVSYLENKWDL